MMDWQPIETAPRDGSFILIVRPDWAIPWHGFYRQEGTLEARHHGEGWSRTMVGDVPLYPTHWMPLPTPPESERLNQGDV